MKKKILSLVLLSLYLFGAVGMVSAEAEYAPTYDPKGSSPTTKNYKNPKYYDNNLSTNQALKSNNTANTFASDPANKATVDRIIDKNGGQCGNKCVNEIETAAANDKVDAVTGNAAGTSTDVVKSDGEKKPDATVDPSANTASTTPEGGKAAKEKKPSGGPDDMTSSGFLLDPSNLSPSEKTYDKGTKRNFKEMLATIGKYLLIATTSIAVLSIVIGGLMISTTGPSDRAAKGKTIIVLNIAAIIIALFSYSIIRLVSWIILI